MCTRPLLTCSAGQGTPCSLILHSKPGALQQEACTLALLWPTHWLGPPGLSMGHPRALKSSASQWALQPG